MTAIDRFLAAWLAITNLGAFLLFATDKQFARRGSQRISESALVLAGALGGWFGGFVAMLLFRHKTAKISFQLKYGVALIVLSGAAWLVWRLRS